MKGLAAFFLGLAIGPGDEPCPCPAHRENPRAEHRLPYDGTDGRRGVPDPDGYAPPWTDGTGGFLILK